MWQALEIILVDDNTNTRQVHNHSWWSNAPFVIPNGEKPTNTWLNDNCIIPIAFGQM